MFLVTLHTYYGHNRVHRGIQTMRFRTMYPFELPHEKVVSTYNRLYHASHASSIHANCTTFCKFLVDSRWITKEESVKTAKTETHYRTMTLLTHRNEKMLRLLQKALGDITGYIQMTPTFIAVYLLQCQSFICWQTRNVRPIVFCHVWLSGKVANHAWCPWCPYKILLKWPAHSLLITVRTVKDSKSLLGIQLVRKSQYMTRFSPQPSCDLTSSCTLAHLGAWGNAPQIYWP